MLVFNGGLVAAVIMGRLSFPSSSHPKAERNLIIITICITLSYVFLSLPIVVYITAFASKLDDRCSGLHSKELLKAVGNCSQLLEHIVHVMFMVGLHAAFRKELKIFLRLDKSAVRKEESTGMTTAEGNMAGRGKGYRLTPRLEQVSSDAAGTSRLGLSVTSDASSRNTILEP